MRIFTFILGLTFICLQTFAQTDTSTLEEFNYFNKGKNILSIQLPTGLFSKSKIYGYQIRYGRFLIKKINVGLQADMLYRSPDYRSFGLGIFGRYYFLTRKFAPFLEANYEYSHTIQDLGIDNSVWNINRFVVNTGFAYTGLLKKLGIELYAGYNFGFLKMKIPDWQREFFYNQITYGLRINYHF